MTRGRGALLALAAALVVSSVAGSVRSALLAAMEPVIVAIYWSWVRRLALGLLLDMPAGVAAIALCALAGRLFSFSPWRAAGALVGTLVLLDVTGSALIVHDMGLWSDPFVLAGRLAVTASTALGCAVVMGYRWHRAPPERPGGAPDGGEPV